MRKVDDRPGVGRLVAIALAALASMLSAVPSASAATTDTQPANTLDWQSCGGSQFDQWKKIDGTDLDGFQCSTFTRPLDRSAPDGARGAPGRREAPGDRAGIATRGHAVPQPGRARPVGCRPLQDRVPAARVGARQLRLRHLRPARHRRVHSRARGRRLQHPQADPSRDRDGRLARRARGAPATGRARANARCFDANRDLVEHGGSLDGAYDLDALRAAVGDDKLTYWGISYGTLLGSTYAQTFPDRVRAMVFDANIDPQTTLAGITVGAVAPDDSIGFFLQATGLRDKFDQVMAELDRRTIPLPDGTRYTRWDLLDTLNDGVDFFPITGETSWTQAVHAVDDSWNARFGTADEQTAARQALTDKRLQSPTTGTAGSLWSAVVCQDFGDRMSNARQQQLLRGIVREGPLYGGSLGVDYLTTCNGYDDAKPHPVPRPETYGPPIAGMIANSTHDGETPYQWAVNMARTYPTMRAVTIVGGLHGSFGLAQSDCVNTAIGDLLASATVPALDTACPYSSPEPAP